MITWKIEKRNIEDLQGYDKNPRKFTDKGLKDLKKSLQNCGDANIITINADNTVLGGHARLTVMKQLGYTEVDVKVPEKQLTEKQVQEVVVRLNANTAGEWDLDKLQVDFELDELQEWGLDIEFTELEEEKEIVEDEVPEEVETRAKRGDIWQLGEHRLMCGDSTSITDVEKLMNGEKADMVFTDPPYGYNYQSNMRTKTEKFDVLKNDDKILDFFPLLKHFNNGFVFVCTTWKVLNKWLPLFEQYYNLSNMIIWNKGGGGIGDLKHTFLTDYEIILCSNNNTEIKGKRIGSVWTISKDNANDYIHATQKPVALSSLAIKNVTLKNDIVLDVFGGSGSTLIACEQLNRKCFMMELDEHYCDVIITRWENLTGQKAVLCS
jgi:DNA modification methylase